MVGEVKVEGRNKMIDQNYEGQASSGHQDKALRGLSVCVAIWSGT